MPDTELDEAGREVATFLRTALQTAAHLAEQRARTREQHLRDAETRSLAAGREYAQRLVAERSAAETQLHAMSSDGWWERTDRQAIADNYLLATAWSGYSALAAQAARLIEREVQARYGVDPAMLTVGTDGPDPRERADADRDGVKEAVDVADRRDQNVRIADLTRTTAENETHTQSSSGVDPSEPDPNQEQPDIVMARTSTSVPGVDYDSTERRAGAATDLESAGIAADVISIRMSADLDQATPATDAVRTPGTTPRARKGRPVGGPTVEREHPCR